jgi:hypothetical protein
VIEAGYYIVVNSPGHEHLHVCRVVNKLTRRLYLVASVCPDHGEQNGLGMFVLDVKLLAEEHPEYGPRGRVFETWDQVETFLHLGEDDETEREPAAVVH